MPAIMAPCRQVTFVTGTIFLMALRTEHTGMMYPVSLTEALSWTILEWMIISQAMQHYTCRAYIYFRTAVKPAFVIGEV